MNTFNHLFSDVFNPRHHKFPGDWHATAQELNPSSQDAETGIFEWIMPISSPQGEENHWISKLMYFQVLHPTQKIWRLK